MKKALIMVFMIFGMAGNVGAVENNEYLQMIESYQAQDYRTRYKNIDAFPEVEWVGIVTKIEVCSEVIWCVMIAVDGNPNNIFYPTPVGIYSELGKSLRNFRAGMNVSFKSKVEGITLANKLRGWPHIMNGDVDQFTRMVGVLPRDDTHDPGSLDGRDFESIVSWASGHQEKLAELGEVTWQGKATWILDGPNFWAFNVDVDGKKSQKFTAKVPKGTSLALSVSQIPRNSEITFTIEKIKRTSKSDIQSIVKGVLKSWDYVKSN